MKKNFILLSVFVCVAGLLLLSFSIPVTDEKMAPGRGSKDLDLRTKTEDLRSNGGVRPDIDFCKLPLYFITNKGQVNEKAKYYARGSRYTLWLTEEGLVFDGVRKRYDRDVSRLLFMGANKDAEMVPLDEARLKVNYFIGNDRSKWHCDVPTSMAVMYRDIYKNIDLKVYGIEKQIEYDWVVKPGGNPADIRFEYREVKKTCIDKEGNLCIETRFGELIHKRPACYQVPGRIQDHRGDSSQQTRVEVGCRFKKIAMNTYGFSLAEYDRTCPLIIDPVILAYSTYLGGGDSDCAYGIAVDSIGNVYVTGDTHSTDFPTLHAYQDQGSYDAFVTRLDTNQGGVSSLIYSTYLGGRSNDHGRGIAVDDIGNVYVTGDTISSDFPTLHAYQGYQGSYDAFVTRLDTNLSGVSSLVYSTYLGGGASDSAYDIAMDGNGNVYVTGYTGSSDFPTLHAFQGHQGHHDAFVTRLDTNQGGTSSLVYSTYLGGNYGDYGNGIAVDGNGNVYVTGYTRSTDFPTLNPYQVYPGDVYLSNVFVTRLDTNLSGTSSLVYSTYLGGGNGDWGSSIATDGNGNVYVTGETHSTDFPTLHPYQGYQGIYDAFVTRLDTNLSGVSSLVYSTYLGGRYYDSSTGIAVDDIGNVYVTGDTTSSDFPTLHPFQEEFSGGFGDAFVTRLDTNLSGVSSLVYSTYLGGGNRDLGKGIAVDSIGNVYVTGETESTDFPTLNPYQGYYDSGGWWDAFVTKMSYATPPTVVTEPVSPVTSTTALCGGNVTSDGNSPVYARGVCWSTSPGPDTKDNHTTDGEGTGAFTSHITGLTPNTTYHVRAYATNSVGTGYGRNISFRTLTNPVISGTISSSSTGTGVPGVILYFSNKGGTTVTTSKGIYRHAVAYNWSGTVTPSKPGYIFSPTNRTYAAVTSDLDSQDYIAYYIFLYLFASRETESGWIVRRQYGKISLSVDNPGHIPMAKYIIYRKESGGDYSPLAEIQGSQIQGAQYIYYDKYLDREMTYTYKFEAVDANGLTIGISNEKTI